MRFLVFVLVSMGVFAQAKSDAFGREVVSCEEAGLGLTSLMTPASENSRSFYNDRVVLYRTDTVEPACCSYGIAIVLPDVKSELGDVKCLAVVHLSGVDLKNAKSSYDPNKGLRIELATKKYNDGGFSEGGPQLNLRINLQNSTVTLE